MPRSHAPRLLGKAEEFAAAARSELAAGRYSAAGLAAIHSAISAADAVTIHTEGIVCAGDNHADVAQVLRESADVDPPASALRQLLGLLRMKNDIEYTERALDQARASVLVDQAERFLGWSRSMVG